MWARIIIFFALLPLPVIADEVSRSVPVKFLGDWCTEALPQEEDAGESDIRISRDEIGYYRASGKILAAAAIGAQLTVIVELKEDDHTWLDTEEFELSEDGKRITSLGDDGQLRTRIRCQF